MGCGYSYNTLANNCFDLDKACNLYFMGTGKLFIMKCYAFQNLLICCINVLTHYSYLCVQLQVSWRKNKYFTWKSTSIAIILKFKKLQPCKARKKALVYRLMTVIGKTYTDWMFYKKITITCIFLFWSLFLPTHTAKVHESQIYLPGNIYYSFLQSIKYEGRKS